jgi:hypothetical protein
MTLLSDVLKSKFFDAREVVSGRSTDRGGKSGHLLTRDREGVQKRRHLRVCGRCTG